MLPSKRAKFKEHGKKEFSIAPSNEKYKFRKVSEEELKKTLIRIKEDAAKERKRRIIGSIIAGLLAALSMCLILYYLDQVFK